MAYQVESKGWVWPDDPDEWLPCLVTPKDTYEEAEAFIESMRSDSWEGARQYPYRIVEV